MRTLIITGREVIYQKETQQAILPGLDGELSVLDFHQPFLYRLRKGLLKIREKDKKSEERIFPIKDGLARFSGNSLLILCEKR